MSDPSFTPRDFGRAAEDYAKLRPGFPESFFKRMDPLGIGTPGQSIVDLGTGTGTLARGFARRGARVTGVDISPELMDEAKRLPGGAGVSWTEGRAEEIPLPDASAHVVTAGQSWFWFDGPEAAREAARILKPGGRLAICHFSYLPKPGNLAALTEGLILKHHPKWGMAGSDGRYERFAEHLRPAGFTDIGSFFYDEEVSFTHEQWRGRIRACNGVIALKDADRIKAYDEELKALLKKKFPGEPLDIPHRIFVIHGRKPL